MDILAHVLWVVLAVEAARRLRYVSGRTAEATLLMAIAPDVLQTLPVLGWIVFGGGTFSMLSAYSLTSTGVQAAMPPAIASIANQLHSLTHSVVVTLAVTLIVAVVTRRLWFPLLGWWLHIAVDMFSHEPAYSSTVLYPIGTWRFNGVAWNEGWFIALNVVMLVAVSVLLYVTRESREPWDDGE